MTMIEAMTEDLRDDGTITGLRHWAKGGHERTYIRVAGYSDRFRGCREYQLYWDHNSAQLVNRPGRGRTPYEFDNAVDTVVAAFGAQDCRKEES